MTKQEKREKREIKKKQDERKQKSGTVQAICQNPRKVSFHKIKNHTNFPLRQEVRGGGEVSFKKKKKVFWRLCEGSL